MTDGVYLVSLNLPHDVYLVVSADDLLAAMRTVLPENAPAHLDEAGLLCRFGDRSIVVRGTPFEVTVTMHGWPRHDEADAVEAFVRVLEARGGDPLDWRSEDGTRHREVDPAGDTSASAYGMLKR